MARQRRLNVLLGQRLLQSKLDVLTGAGGRRPSMALSILTGGSPEPRPADEIPEPLPFPSPRRIEPEAQPDPAPAELRAPRRRFSPRTVYLSDRHLRDLDAILEVLQPEGGRRLTRSAVLRQAIEHLSAEISPHPTRVGAASLEDPEHA